ncbi:hypothetical protein SLA2020_262870 [Shorea laevis]
MHDLLQEVGREIVRKESLEPGERSRLWFHEDVLHVLEENTGTNNVEGILIDFPGPDLIHLSPKAFKKMKRLRLIIIRNAHFSKEPAFLSNELRLIDWPKYPGESFPSNFRGKNLVILRMPDSHLRELKAIQNFQNVTIMNLSDCKFLREIPDVSRISNLETLYLSGCKNLVKVHRSVGFLDKLVDLNLCRCTNLRSFPRSLKLKSLKNLNLARLEDLTLNDCTNLMHLPNGVYQLQNLESIQMENCKQLREISRLPPNLKYMVAYGCDSLAIFLEEARRSQFFNTQGPLEPVGFGMCLKHLDLSGSDIVTLPRCIESFVELESLTLKNCKRLREVPKLPPSIERLAFARCPSLEIFQFNDIYDLPKLQWINLVGCPEHIRNDVQIQLLSEGHSKKHQFGCIFPGNKIPDYFSHRDKASNTNSRQIDISEPVHLDLDLENTRFAFCAVIGEEDVQDEARFQISVQVINNGQEIYSGVSFARLNLAGSDHVWLDYHGSHHSQIKTGNLLVKFRFRDILYGKPSKSVFFKSCGFHLEHRYEEKAIDSMYGIQHSKRRRDDDDDDVNLESNRYPQPKRGNVEFQMLMKPLGESQLHQSNQPQHLQPPFHVFL